jgi:hypothetical protein
MSVTLNVYPASTKRSKRIDPLANYKAGIAAARRLGYHVGDAEVPHGWHEPGSGPAGQNNNNTTTLGATDPAGMKTDLVASFPLQGARFVYTPVTTPNGDWIIYRRDLQSKSTIPPEQMSGTYSAGENSFLWADMTTTDYRIWRTVRQTTANDPWNRGSGRDYDAQDKPLQALQDRLTARTMRTPNADTGSQEYGGVGAESWVNGRQNSTGYQINAADARGRRGAITTTSDSDSRRPGIAIGRSTAKLVARRVDALHQLNEANRKAWS